ncbi:helix-turn-helix transcriptional regulator [Ureibacillus composti]|nr:helix-turn-helix transcriptional regulator [Ureibacillus composti]
MIDNNSLPFTHNYDYRMIKLVRQIRNLTLSEFSTYMNVNQSTIALLEKSQLEFSVHYQSKFHEALKQLNVSNIEFASLTILLEHQKTKQGSDDK